MVNFSQSNYNANENDELVQLMLVLSNPSSSDIIVYVDTIDREATGERFLLIKIKTRLMYHVVTSIKICSFKCCSSNGYSSREFSTFSTIPLIRTYVQVGNNQVSHHF